MSSDVWEEVPIIIDVERTAYLLADSPMEWSKAMAIAEAVAKFFERRSVWARDDRSVMMVGDGER